MKITVNWTQQMNHTAPLEVRGDKNQRKQHLHFAARMGLIKRQLKVDIFLNGMHGINCPQLCCKDFTTTTTLLFNLYNYKNGKFELIIFFCLADLV